MKTPAPTPWTIGIAIAAVALGFIDDGAAHPGHGGTMPAPVPAPRIAAPRPAPLQAEVHTSAIARCTWQVDPQVTDTSWGGVFATCDESTFPVAAAVWVPDWDVGEHNGLVNFSPGIHEWDGATVDGFVDGQPLADDHPQIHGEPPPDTMTEAFANNDSVCGAGVHYVYTGDSEPNEILSLCCESLDPKPDLDELENCRYKTELVPVTPESDPDLAGQYVATLACSVGRVTSGGCYSQFLHTSEWSLTSSHPYVDGDPMQHPSGDHATQPTETGWACRLDREPVIDYPPDFVESIAVTVLCCL